MYETEINAKIESAEQIPPSVLDKFAKPSDNISKRTVLPWAEHCTECVWPTCYASCDLYTPREDLKCRRFVDGMVRIDAPATLNSYLLKIRFKRWAQLLTVGSFQMHPISLARSIEARDKRIGGMLYRLPVPSPLRNVFIGRRYNYKKRRARRTPVSVGFPDYLLIETYNPGETQVSISLSIRSLDATFKIPFQRLFKIGSGYSRMEVPYRDIASLLNPTQPFQISLTPNEIPDDTPLYFGVIDFVKAARSPRSKANPIKCIVWDLDGTLWDGVLAEEETATLVPKAALIELIRTLDSRGILHSIASKNNFQEALGVLRRFDLDQLFLYPHISWMPKSQAIETIAHKLNIALDSILFIDDSAFELAEVQTSLPGVRVIEASRALSFLSAPEFDLPVTAESANRRQLYRLSSVRDEVAQTFGNDYFGFLRDCRIELRISSMTSDNLNRVHELTQRTNQLNFSGNRYTRATLEHILLTNYFDTFVIECEDRFGSYGTIGFSLVDRREPRIVDLMFSCRVQSKRVEHAFLSWVLRKYIAELGRDCYISYHKTPRNSPSGKVFDDFAMELISEVDGVSSLVFRHEREVPDDGIIPVRMCAQVRV